jgi:hypothetical protein
MKSLTVLTLAILLWTVNPGRAQYILPYDTLNRSADTLQEEHDSLWVPDTLEVTEPEPPLDTNYVRPKPGQFADANENLLKQSNTWLRRLLFRGWLDTSHIGAFMSYQLTAWSPSIGSYGPVEARVTIYYLGPTEWMGKDAEWLQAAVQMLSEESRLVEYDLIVPSRSKITEIYRLLYRVDRGEVKSGSLDLPATVMDYDKLDDPIDEGLEDLEFYSGIYQTHLYHGSGSNGAEVYIYRADKMPPLGIVALGYGDEGLTYTSSGSDASPRFYVPPPPGR